MCLFHMIAAHNQNCHLSSRYWQPDRSLKTLNRKPPCKEALWNKVLKPTKGASIMTYTTLGVPYYDYSMPCSNCEGPYIKVRGVSDGEGPCHSFRPVSDRLAENSTVAASPTWRFVGSFKWGYKSPTMGYNYGCPTYNRTYNYP